ncbi:hypothetical protein E2C01_028561 [Portunus trituberculatus]|uniref:Uncharacterized protein n=1 Tax=Portunus trituberculatus TaxID=210409 RepID=A0A5B7ES09_PORTR|nr:hypothetical protein [Portunus trituberculatus]
MQAEVLVAPAATPSTARMTTTPEHQTLPARRAPSWALLRGGSAYMHPGCAVGSYCDLDEGRWSSWYDVLHKHDHSVRVTLG